MAMKMNLILFFTINMAILMVLVYMDQAKSKLVKKNLLVHQAEELIDGINPQMHQRIIGLSKARL